MGEGADVSLNLGLEPTMGGGGMSPNVGWGEFWVGGGVGKPSPPPPVIWGGVSTFMGGGPGVQTSPPPSPPPPMHRLPWLFGGGGCPNL